MDPASSESREVLAFAIRAAEHSRAGELGQASVALWSLARMVAAGVDVSDSAAETAVALQALGRRHSGHRNDQTNLALLAGYLRAVVLAARADERMRCLEPLLERNFDEAMGAVDWSGYVRLQNGVVVGRLGRSEQALELLDRVAGDRAARPATGWVAFQAGYASVYFRWTLQRWTDVIVLAGPVAERWKLSNELTFAERERLALVLWMRCGAVANAARTEGRDYDERANLYLEDLLGWLRDQDPLLRVFRAHRLINKVQWNAWSDTAVDALDEFTDILGALDNDDVLELADGMLSETVWLNYASPEDAQLLSNAATMAIKEGAPMPAPGEIGLAPASIARFQRLSTALRMMANRLQAIPGEKAAALRSEAIVGALAPLGSLGRSQEQQGMFDELVALDRTAIAACDAIVARIDERAQFTAFRPATEFVKASLLVAEGQLDEAIPILTDLASVHKDDPDPVLATFSTLARQLTTLLESGL